MSWITIHLIYSFAIIMESKLVSCTFDLSFHTPASGRGFQNDHA
jgi:hypothetical protein